MHDLKGAACPAWGIPILVALLLLPIRCSAQNLAASSTTGSLSPAEFEDIGIGKRIRVIAGATQIDGFFRGAEAGSVSVEVNRVNRPIPLVDIDTLWTGMSHAKKGAAIGGVGLG